MRELDQCVQMKAVTSAIASSLEAAAVRKTAAAGRVSAGYGPREVGPGHSV